MYEHSVFAGGAVTWLARSTWIALDILCVVVFVITGIFWTVLCSSGCINWSNLNVHAFNGWHDIVFILAIIHIIIISAVLFAMLTILPSRITLIPTHFAVVLVYALVYLAFTQIAHAAGNHWQYNFLVDTTNASIAWYAGLFIGHIVVFFVIMYVLRLRDWLARRYIPRGDDDSTTLLLQ